MEAHILPASGRSIPRLIRERRWWVALLLLWALAIGLYTHVHVAQMREQMKSLPPEARKMMEQQLAGHGMGMGADGALRLCIGPEDAKQDPIREGHTEGDCTYTQVKRSGNTWTGRLTCKEPPSQGDFTTTLHSATHFTTKAALTSKEHGRIDMNTEARRLSADCGTLKPVAQSTPKR